MVKTLLGFVIGVTLTGLTFLILDADPDRIIAPARFQDGVGNSDSDALESFDNRSDSLGGIDVADEQVLEQSPPAEPSGNVSEDSLSQRERLEERFDEAGRAVREAIMAQDEASRALREFDLAQLTVEPVLTHLPLTREFDWLNADGWTEFRTNHERIQREPRDQRWAAPAEQQLWNFLTDRQEFIQTYGAPTITCAETMCELTLVSYGVSAETAYGDFADLRREFMGNPDYRDSFELNPQWAERAEDGTAALFVILRRRAEFSQTQSRVASALK